MLVKEVLQRCFFYRHKFRLSLYINSIDYNAKFQNGVREPGC